jgi:hypothetical protein
MENVTVEVQGSTIVIKIDGTKDLGPSSSGKTRLVGSTQGNKQFTVAGRQVYLGINAYTK